MFNKVITKLKSFFSKQGLLVNLTEIQGEQKEVANNNSAKGSQIKLLIGILILVIFGLGLLIKLVQEKVETDVPVKKAEVLRHELADKALDGEKFWRNHHEDELNKTKVDLTERINKVEEEAEQAKIKLMEDTQNEIVSLKAQVSAVREELLEAGRNLKEMSDREQERTNSTPHHMEAVLEMQNFGDEIEYDTPKSAADYVPEGTYFTGYLLGGIEVSTALNTAEENPVSVTIILKGRGNLAEENEIDISNCRIFGSAKGDLSTERAIIRLEKLICKKDGMYITSYIAGDVHGPDGLNGVKGTVVSTGSKHLKNAMIGGMISGLSSSAKGQDALNLTAGGLLSTQKKGFKDMATDGALSGVSNVGEKLADHHLRLADSLSPVLEIPGGVRVNPHIAEGFFMGEVGTHKRIRESRAKRTKTQANREQHVRRAASGDIKESGDENGNW